MADEATHDTAAEQSQENASTEARLVPQEKVDQIIKDRLARQRQQFADYDDLKAKAEQLDQLQAERQTEVEKAIARAEKAEAKARAEAEQRENLAAQLRENTVRSEVFRSAATAEIGLDVDDIYRLIDHSKVTITDTGEVRGVSEAIQVLAEKYPKRSLPGGFDGGARTVVREGSTSADFNERLRRQARGD